MLFFGKMFSSDNNVQKPLKRRIFFHFCLGFFREGISGEVAKVAQFCSVQPTAPKATRQRNI